MAESPFPGRGRGGEQPLPVGTGRAGTAGAGTGYAAGCAATGYAGTGLASLMVASTGTAGTGYAGTMFESTAVASDWPAWLDGDDFDGLGENGWVGSLAGGRWR
jgi:hypothetical protein